MKNLETAIELAEKLIAEKAAYDARPTKASSKRMRDYLNQSKKVATAAKQELIEADKA
jgi:hypothetical protein